MLGRPSNNAELHSTRSRMSAQMRHARESGGSHGTGPLSSRLQALPMLTPAAKARLVSPAQAYLARMEAALGQDCEALTDGGRDRTFVSATSSLLRVSKLLAECDSSTRADQLVGAPWVRYGPVWAGCQGLQFGAGAQGLHAEERSCMSMHCQGKLQAWHDAGRVVHVHGLPLSWVGQCMLLRVTWQPC